MARRPIRAGSRTAALLARPTLATANAQAGLRGFSAAELRDIAQTVGVTERSAHRIVSQLVEDGYVVRERIGRRNAYKVKRELPLHHPLAQETEQRRIGDLLEVLLGEDGRGSARRERQRTS